MWKKFKDNFVIIFLTIVSIAALSVSLISAINNPVAEDKGIMTVKLIDELGEVLDERQIMFSETEDMMSVLERSYPMNYEYYAAMGVFLKKIGPIDTSNYPNHYIGIYIDGVYSNIGISSIKPRDGIVISFVLTDWTLE